MKLKSIYKLSLNHYRKHLVQSILLVLGIALGVSVIVAIDIANNSAKKSFQNSVKKLNGNITHSIHSASDKLDEDIYFNIRKILGYEGVSPVIEKVVKMPDSTGKVFRIIGIDPFSESELTGLFHKNGITLNSYSFDYLLTEKNAAIVSEDFKERNNLSLGDNFAVKYGTATLQLKAVGILKPDNAEQRVLLTDKIIVDISTAQEIFDFKGFISRIDINIGDESSNKEYELKKYLAGNVPGVYLVRGVKLDDENKKLTQAFGLNLKALSFITILVAFFLIYNTFNYALVVRRPVFSILRSIGVTPNEIFRLILAEALLAGLLGCITGILLGVYLGGFSIDLVKKTYSSIYYINTGIFSELLVSSIIKSLVIGLTSVVLAVVAPAIESRYIKPVNVARVSFMNTAFDKIILKLLLAGTFMAALGLYFSLDTRLSIKANFIALFVLIIGYSLSLPVIMKTMGGVFYLLQTKVFKRVYLIACKNYLQSIGTNFTATASLVIAVSVFLSMTVLIDSFRTTLTKWLNNTFDSDLFISVLEGEDIKRGFSYDTLDIISSIKGTSEIGYSRKMGIITESYGFLKLLALSENPPIKPQIIDKFDKSLDSFSDLSNNEVLISESLYQRNKDKFHMKRLYLPTIRGISSYEVKGIFSDFATQKGTVIMNFDTFKMNWGDNELTSISFNIVPGFQQNDIIRDINSKLSDNYNYKITSNTDLKKAAYNIFDQTFVITKAMRIIAFIVAFFGILGALLCLELSKNKQIGILRSIGARISDIKKIIILETGIIGIISGVLSLPLGIVMSYVLVRVINFKSFGWTIDFLLKPQHLVEAVLLSIVAAMLAGIYPAYIFSNLKISELLKQE